jgi:hypothetical protein
MNVTEIVATAVATLIVLVLAHMAVYWVVKTLYPPQAPALAPVPAPVIIPVEEPVKTVTFTEPPSTLQQNVTLPTYEAPVPDAAPRETGERRGPPPAESTSIRRDPGVVAPNAQ